jgi:hypothetical protein
VIGAGDAQVRTGVTLPTVRFTLAVAGAKSVVLVGLKVTESVSVPAAGTDPAGGRYVKVPATEAVASNCVADSAVPYAIDAAAAHVITGTAWVMFRLIVELELVVYEE